MKLYFNSEKMTVLVFVISQDLAQHLHGKSQLVLSVLNVDHVYLNLVHNMS